MSPASPAQRKATDKYIKNTFDEIKIRVPKGRKSAIQAVAATQDESLNTFAVTAIDERMERLEGKSEQEK
jgi:predicted HicB family RNase H-like nuclease